MGALNPSGSGNFGRCVLPRSPNCCAAAAPCVTAPASAAAFPPTMQVPRRTPLLLCLGSLDDFARCPTNEHL